MKQILLIFLIFVFSNASNYSDGFKLYIKAKHELKSNQIESANELFKKAKNKFYLASKKNNAQALLKLAELYCNGLGIDKNRKKALKYLKKAKMIIPNIHIFNKCLKKIEGESK
jgi:TPR repeat protein